MTEDQERDIRIKCIEFAQKSMSHPYDESVIKVAQKYYWFITAKTAREGN